MRPKTCPDARNRFPITRGYSFCAAKLRHFRDMTKNFPQNPPCGGEFCGKCIVSTGLRLENYLAGAAAVNADVDEAGLRILHFPTLEREPARGVAAAGQDAFNLVVAVVESLDTDGFRFLRPQRAVETAHRVEVDGFRVEARNLHFAGVAGRHAVHAVHYLLGE